MEAVKESLPISNTIFKMRCFINKSHANQGYSFEVHPHWHDMVEVLFVMHGNPIQQINEHVFHITTGDIVIIRGQDIHSTYSLSNEFTEILVIQFDKSIFNIYDPHIARAYELFSRKVNISFAINSMHLPGSDLYNLMIEVKKEYESQKPAWELAVMSRCAEIVIICCRNYYDNDGISQHNVKVKNDLKKVFDYVEQNFENKITIEQIAKVINYSIPNFCRVFKKSVGMSFIEYLNQYKIKMGIEMLKKDIQVTEIALKCGFSSINSFIRTFKKYTGVSPGKFYLEKKD